MPRVGLSRDSVVDVALEVVDEDGPDALTLAAVAKRTGVATPSLYNHVRNLGELRRLVALRVLAEMADRLGLAVMGRSGEDALAELVEAYLRYAAEHPGRYAVLPQSPGDDPEVADVAARVVRVIFAVVRGFGLDGSPAVHATRCVRAAAHGLASLRNTGGFRLPEDVEATRVHLVRMLAAGLRAWSDGGAVTR